MENIFFYFLKKVRIKYSKENVKLKMKCYFVVEKKEERHI